MGNCCMELTLLCAWDVSVLGWGPMGNQWSGRMLWNGRMVIDYHLPIVRRPEYQWCGADKCHIQMNKHYQNIKKQRGLECRSKQGVPMCDNTSVIKRETLIKELP